MTPYESIETPDGKVGYISQVATAPPMLENVTGVIVTLRVKTILVCEGMMLALGSLMARLRVALALPPELLAQMV